MKDLSRFVDDTFVKPLSSRLTQALIVLLIATAWVGFKDRAARKDYESSPTPESKILQKYDKGIRGFYSPEDMKNLLEDYTLTRRDNPELKYIPSNKFTGSWAGME